MKIKLYLLLVFGLFLGLPVVAFATGSTSSGYNEPVPETSLAFEAVLNGSQVETSWAKFAPEGFNYYKVVRSATNSDPVYPDDGYIYYTSDADTTSYTDAEVPSGTSYYRVCSIVSPERYCSSVVTIEYNGDGTTGSSQEEEEGETLDDAVIDLEGSVTDEGVVLEWTLEAGSAPYGFKVAYSKTNESPVYPGDSYAYLSDPGVRRYKHADVKAGYTYHYRVCQYNGDGTCGSYSNSVALAIPGDYTTTSTEKSVTEKVIATTDEYQALKDEIAALKTKVAQLEAFVDTQRHRYEAAINYLREQGIVQGYDDGSYRPDNTINRAEFMKIVMGEKYGDELTAEEADCFSDVGKEWYAPYVCLGKDKGVVSGYGNGYFRPGNQISFVEAAKILANVYGLDLGDEGSQWYEKYVRALQEEGYIPDSVDELAKPITRAEMAELIWRIKEQVRDQAHSELISEPVQVNEGDYKGWTVFEGSDFRFYHPGWYQGTKWSRTLLTDELDFYQNLNTPNYLDVDSYMTVYDVAGTDLNTAIWAEHPLVSSTEMTVNGIRALKRHFRAPRGTVVNGRTTGENENITVYTFEVNGRTVVLEYFNAYGTENQNVETFYKIASSFELK